MCATMGENHVSFHPRFQVFITIVFAIKLIASVVLSIKVMHTTPKHVPHHSDNKSFVLVGLQILVTN